MEVCVVGHNEDLLDIVTLDIGASIVGIVVADANHTTHNGTDDKESVAVHAGYRVINDNDFVAGIGTFRSSFEASVCGGVANLTITANQLIEIQECDKVAFALTQPGCHFAIGADYLIGVFDSCFGLQFKTLEAGIPEQIVDALNGLLGIDTLLIEFLDFSHDATPVSSGIFNRFFRPLMSQSNPAIAAL